MSSSSVPINCEVRTHRIVTDLTDLPTHVIVEILTWLDQENLMEMGLVSKQMNRIIKNHDMIEPVLEIRSRDWNNKKFFQNFICSSWQRFSSIQQKQKAEKLQHYPVLRIVNCKTDRDQIPHYDMRQLKMIPYEENDLKVEYVKKISRFTKLELISHPSIDNYPNTTIMLYLPRMLPHLHAIHIFNVGVSLPRFTRNCSLLEKINLLDSSHINWTYLDGNDMRNAHNLKELFINGVQINILCTSEQVARLWDLNDYQELYLFHYCCMNLERVSLQNVVWNFAGTRYHFSAEIAQKILIKFVRNAPSLRWFQSELIPENMAMLRLERPGIQLLN